jgi:hypothetical protein
MTTLAELKLAIDAILNHRLGISNWKLNRTVEEKAYEAYVFSLCARAVAEMGGKPVARTNQGTPGSFVFRGGPGQIHSQRANYGYLRFTMVGDDYELHAGVEFRGTSEMMHELDVCIMRAVEADRCRGLTPDDPNPRSLLGAWECKFYGKTVGKDAGREFVGLLSDMGNNCRTAGLCSNVESTELRKFLRPRRRPNPHFLLIPAHGPLEDEFVGHLKSELRKATCT